MFGGRSKKNAASSSLSSLQAANKQYGVGIANLGNSCYMASVLQGLAASRPLRDALASYPGAEKAIQTFVATTDQEKQDVTELVEEQLHDFHGDKAQPRLETPTKPPLVDGAVLPPSTPTAETSPSLRLLSQNPFPESLPLSSSLANTLVKLWSGKQSVVSAKSLMKALNRKSDDWNEYDQMDAHELLRYLLDGVSMEEFDLIKKLQPPPPEKKIRRKTIAQKALPLAQQLKAHRTNTENVLDQEVSSESDMSTSEAESLLAEDPSYRPTTKAPPAPRYTPFIESIFGGRLASVIVCEGCRGVARIEEDFLDLSLSIKSDDGKIRKRERLRKFLSSSSEKPKDSDRPKMAARAPSNILGFSETERSEDEGDRFGLPKRQLSNLSSNSQASDASGDIGDTVLRNRRNSNALSDDDRVQRRRSLDPALLRSGSTKRNFLSPQPATAIDKLNTPKGSGTSLKRGFSLRAGGSSDSGNSPLPSSGHSSTAASSVRSRAAVNTSSHLLSKPSREQQDYIRKLFAEIPGPSPLAALRVAYPAGSLAPQAAADPPASVVAKETHEALSSGLYACLLQFTSVETLEAEDARECRRCWKLLNPALVAEVGRRRATKNMQRRLRSQGTISNIQQAGDPGTTNSYSMSTVTSGRDSRMIDSSSMVHTNRQLLAEKIRQDLQTSTPQIGPEITITATSPPISRHASDALRIIEAEQMAAAARLDAEADASGFSSLTVTQSNSADGQGRRDGLASDSDAELSDVANLEGDVFRRKASLRSTASSAGTSISFADGTAPSKKESSRPNTASSIPRSPMSIHDMLPKRSQRFVARKAHKRYLVSTLPSLLVFHLKRFQQTSKSSMFGSFNNLKKLDDRVTFPLYLDMSPFIAPPPLREKRESSQRLLDSDGDISTSAFSGDGERGRSASSSTEDRKHWFRRRSPSAELRAKSQYRLYGVISHQGNMSQGHYIAYTLTSQRKTDGQHIPDAESKLQPSDHQAKRQWVFYSDDDVRVASLEEVLKTQAYCLLYERITTPESSKL